MSHLEDLAAALVDDELDHEQRDRALAHLAGCAECRADVEAQRELKARLGGQPAPMPSVALVERLHAVPFTVSAPARRRTRVATRVGRRPAASRPVRGPNLSRGRRVLVDSFSFVVAALGLSLAVGGNTTSGGVRPSSAVLVEHAATTSQLPLNDPAAGLVLTSFSR